MKYLFSFSPIEDPQCRGKSLPGDVWHYCYYCGSPSYSHRHVSIDRAKKRDGEVGGGLKEARLKKNNNGTSSVVVYPVMLLLMRPQFLGTKLNTGTITSVCVVFCVHMPYSFANVMGRTPPPTAT